MALPPNFLRQTKLKTERLKAGDTLRMLSELVYDLREQNRQLQWRLRRIEQALAEKLPEVLPPIQVHTGPREPGEKRKPPQPCQAVPNTTKACNANV